MTIKSNSFVYDGINIGSVMEGIFAMYCAAYLIDPNDGRNSNQVESFIDELRFNTFFSDLKGEGKQSVDYHDTFPMSNKLSTKFFKEVSIVSGGDARKLLIDPKQKRLISTGRNYFETIDVANYNDFTQVELKVRVKKAETDLFYGKEFARLVKAIQKEQKLDKKVVEKYEDIRAKMKTLIKQKENTFFRNLKKAKQMFLANNKSDVVNYKVDADGIEGETSGGDIKQDVTIVISANGKRLLKDELNFSVKSDNVQVHGGGLSSEFKTLYDMFIPLLSPSAKTKAKKFIQTYETAAPKGRFPSTAKTAMFAIWGYIGESFPDKPDTSYSSELWKMLEKRIFGAKSSYTGKIQLFEMKQNELREVDYPNFMRLARDSGCLLYPKYKPGKMKNGKPTIGLNYYMMPMYMGKKPETNTSKAVFQFSIKRRFNPAGEIYLLKVATNLGGVKSIIHDENYDDFVKQKLANPAKLKEVKDYKPL